MIDVRETFADAATLSQEDAKCDRIGEWWWAGQDSNLQPDRYERPALTIELPARPERAGPRVKRKTRAVAMRSRANRLAGGAPSFEAAGP